MGFRGQVLCHRKMMYAVFYFQALQSTALIYSVKCLLYIQTGLLADCTSSDTCCLAANNISVDAERWCSCDWILAVWLQHRRYQCPSKGKSYICKHVKQNASPRIFIGLVLIQTYKTHLSYWTNQTLFTLAILARDNMVKKGVPSYIN